MKPATSILRFDKDYNVTSGRGLEWHKRFIESRNEVEDERRAG